MSVSPVLPPSTVVKRSGAIAPFDGDKICSAIERAGKATGAFDAAEAQLLSSQTLKVLAHRFHDRAPHIEQIQDVVEQVLISANHFATARAYIVYREQRTRLRSDHRTLVDVASSMNEYLERADWRVNANANQGYSLGGLILNVSGKVVANYWLSHVYSPEIGIAHREGDLHIHDLDMLAGYCAGWSLRMLLLEGLNGVPGKVEAGPPKHLSSAVGQIVNFLGTLQNEWAGAQAFSSFDTYMAPFIRKDNLPYVEVRQSIQELVYNLNVPSRWGTQTPFTNLTFDWTCPEDLRDQIPVVGGHDQPCLHRGHDRGRCLGPRLYLSDSHVQHHARLPLGKRKLRAALRDDGQVRAAVFSELPQLRAEAQHGSLHVLPPATGPDRTAEARQRPVRQRGTDRLGGRGYPQLRAPWISPPRRRRGPFPPPRRTA
jgi:ribonucleoside-triphosphate reductase